MFGSSGTGTEGAVVGAVTGDVAGGGGAAAMMLLVLELLLVM